jgi:hypothetical protein
MILGALTTGQIRIVDGQVISGFFAGCPPTVFMFPVSPFQRQGKPLISR